MPITADELERRRNYLGASDVPAIFGLCRWRTPYDVWAEKTGRVDGQAQNKYTEGGTRFEGPVADWAEEQLGRLLRNVEVVKTDLRLIVHCDAVLDATGEPVEIKTSGLYGPLPDDWRGEFGSDDLPDRVIVQVHAQMLGLDNGAQRGHVAAFLGGRGFGLFHMQRSQELIDTIGTAVPAFWREYVERDTPPPDCGPSPEVAWRLRRRAGLIVPVDVDLVRAWHEAREQRLAAEKTEEQRKAPVLAALGEAECGDAGELGLVTYKASESRRLDGTALRLAHPDIAEQFRVLTTSRTLRLVKPKMGKKG